MIEEIKYKEDKKKGVDKTYLNIFLIYLTGLFQGINIILIIKYILNSNWFLLFIALIVFLLLLPATPKQMYIRDQYLRGKFK